MPVEVRLPELAETITDAKLAAWLKREGDAVVAGEPIAEIETEKTNVELEAPVSGVLRKIYVAEGTEGLESGGLLALVDEGDAHVSTGPVVAPAVAERPAETEQADAVVVDTAPVETPPLTGPETAADTATADVAATPLARRMAAVAGLDLASGEGEIAAEEVHLAGSRNEVDLQPGAMAVDDDIRRLTGHGMY